MAICAEVPGVEVTVKVAGNEATEYDDVDGHQSDRNEKQASHRAFAYIEALDDACFSVTFSASTHKFATNNDRLVFELYVDGKRQSGRVLSRSEGPFTLKGIEQKKSKEWHLNLFKFSSIRTTSGGDVTQVKKDIKVSKDLGLIEVRVLQALYTGELNILAAGSEPSNCPMELAEKSLKGKTVSHGTSYADGGIINPPHFVNLSYPNGRKPLVTFNFKYRSKEALEKELIIARALSPDSDDAAIDTLSQEEIRRLARERLRSLREIPNVKKEDAVIPKRESEDVLDLTEEGIESRAKRVRLSTIDLTGEE